MLGRKLLRTVRSWWSTLRANPEIGSGYAVLELAQLAQPTALLMFSKIPPEVWIQTVEMILIHNPRRVLRGVIGS